MTKKKKKQETNVTDQCQKYTADEEKQGSERVPV